MYILITLKRKISETSSLVLEAPKIIKLNILKTNICSLQLDKINTFSLMSKEKHKIKQ